METTLRAALEDKELVSIVVSAQDHSLPAGGDDRAFGRGLVALLGENAGGEKKR